jgi:hypothetical protein
MRSSSGEFEGTVSGGGPWPGRAEVVHGGLCGVGGEEIPEFLGCRLEEVAVAVGVEGFEGEGDVGGVLGDAGAVGVAVVPVAGQDAGGVRVDDLAGLGVLDGVGLAERSEGLGSVRVADVDVAGDVVQVEGAGGQSVADGDGVVGVDGRVDAREAALLRDAPAERVDAGADAAGVGAEGTVGGVPCLDAGSVSSAGCQVPAASCCSSSSSAVTVWGQGSRPRRPVAVTRAMRVSGKASATAGLMRKVVTGGVRSGSAGGVGWGQAFQGRCGSGGVSAGGRWARPGLGRVR